MSKINNINLEEWQPTHRHYKGGFYRVLFEVVNTETEEMMVVYETADGRKWARPSKMFHEALPDGRRRFESLK
jgi:hypothetical protein